MNAIDEVKASLDGLGGSIDRLVAERDQLREELKSCDKYAKEQYKAYDEQLDHWKSVAAKLAEALTSFSLQRKSCDETYNGGHQGDKCKAFHHGMNTVFNVYDDYAKAAVALFSHPDGFSDILKRCAEFQPNAIKMFRKNKFVFRGKGGRWEKLAFTLYTDLCQIHSICTQALEASKQAGEGR